MIHFSAPGNPLEWTPAFRPTFKRRTREGLVCYFCGVKPDKDSDSPVPCCVAAHEMNQEMRKRAVRSIWDLMARQVKE